MNTLHPFRLLSVLCFALLSATPSSFAQQAGPAPSPEEAIITDASLSLPDAPGALLTSDSAASAPDVTLSYTQASAAGGPSAPKFHRIIKPFETAQPLSAKDKFVLAFKGEVGLNTFASALLSAGWGQINDSRPHYGTDRGAFGERLGASALTGASRSFLSYGLYASLFHQDPRYYVMGDSHKFLHRAVYSATRPVLVGAPGQHSTINWSNLAGTASSAALANTYYPEVDRVASKTVTSAVSSLATQAAVSELHEFLGDVFRKIRHKN